MEGKKKSTINKSHKKPLIELNKIISYVGKLLSKKYFISIDMYNKMVIKNIIYDERNKLVSIFKENLIMNEPSEFLKRYYIFKESKRKLTKYYEFYNKYSKLFPNYIPLYESKYIYKNIHKKQKIIDMQQNEESSDENSSLKNRNNKSKNNKIFSSEIYESIVKNSENLNSEIFGIHKNEKNDKNENGSLNQIEKLVSSINKYELEFENEVNSNNKNYRMKYDKNLKDKNIIINNYYYNNSSVVTKQSTIPSIISQQQKNLLNDKILSILNNNILIGLKKKRKRKYFHNNINSSIALKNLITYGLMNNNEERTANINKSKHILEETYSFLSSSRKSKMRSTTDNRSLNFVYNSKISSHNYSNSNNSNILKNNIQRYYKGIMLHTTRMHSSQNKKLIEGLNKLNHLNINNNYLNSININKSGTNHSNKNMNKKRMKKNNFSLTNKLILNKTNCLSDRRSHFFDKKKKKKKLNNKHQNLGNVSLKKTPNNTSRNNSDNNKLKKYIKVINKNLKKSTRKKVNKIYSKLHKKIYDINKNYKNKNLTNTSLKYHQYNMSKILFQKSIINKTKIEKCGIKTERENSKRKNFNEVNSKKTIEIKNYFLDKMKKIQHTYIKNIKGLKNSKNKKLNNDKDYATKSFIGKRGFIIDNNIHKLDLKSKNLIDEYKIKKNLFFNQENNGGLFLYNNFYSTENSVNYSNNDNFKEHKRKLSSGDRAINSKIFIDVNNRTDSNISLNNNFNYNKKPSVIKIKGIQIKNFNKILNINKESSKSNTSTKSYRIKKKILLKIPKNINIEMINKLKIKKSNKSRKKKNNKSNLIFSNFPKSLTERGNSKKINFI